MGSRFSENTLFSVLISVVVGWTVVSVAHATSSKAIPSVSCTLAKTAAGISRS